MLAGLMSSLGPSVRPANAPVLRDWLLPRPLRLGSRKPFLRKSKREPNKYLRCSQSGIELVCRTLVKQSDQYLDELSPSLSWQCFGQMSAFEITRGLFIYNTISIPQAVLVSHLMGGMILFITVI